MDNQEQEVDKNYKLGFNHGYWLSSDGGKYLDEAYNSVKDKNSTYIQGFNAGKKQWQKERFISQIQDETKQNDKQRGDE